MKKTILIVIDGLGLREQYIKEMALNWLTHQLLIMLFKEYPNSIIQA
nr:hypothetical protein [Mycoplasmopsis bovis]